MTQCFKNYCRCEKSWYLKRKIPPQLEQRYEFTCEGVAVFKLCNQRTKLDSPVQPITTAGSERAQNVTQRLALRKCFASSDWPAGRSASVDIAVGPAPPGLNHRAATVIG
ncbi:hypothetical protein RRG08_039461 [Elysia crispata]|uniref:Uncharacterized protein n=1 Tax=Elysia crispata TaxID=231223 RepID=A0AAE0YJL3_9GAST|nr:hypothetical protein RRG08_039461 [Elysia crispata]